MPLTAPTLDDFTLTFSQDTLVHASLDKTFAALLEQMGPANTTPDGTPLPMKIEPWPGGRWFRDLGSDNGHFWAHVQAIKRPTLLELCGPLFISNPVMSNVQYRLKAVDGGTLLAFRHTALGFISAEVRGGISHGWIPLLDRIRQQAETA